jgi:hypothetical protein
MAGARHITLTGPEEQVEAPVGGKVDQRGEGAQWAVHGNPSDGQAFVEAIARCLTGH